MPESPPEVAWTEVTSPPSRGTDSRAVGVAMRTASASGPGAWRTEPAPTPWARRSRTEPSGRTRVPESASRATGLSPTAVRVREAVCGRPVIVVDSAVSTRPPGLTTTKRPAAADTAMTAPSVEAVTAPPSMSVATAPAGVKAVEAGAEAEATHRSPSSGSSTPTRSPPWTATAVSGRETAAPTETSATAMGATEPATRSDRVTVSPAWPMSKSAVSVRSAESRVRES